MPRLLVLFAHPALEKSRVNRRLLAAISDLEGVKINDLYEEYPDFDIDVEREQTLLLDSDIVVLMHPFYWYSTPALLKQWFDLVLEHGFAYGTGGTALTGKKLLCAITTGGSASAYTRGGFHDVSIHELLAPVRQTARLCHLDFLEPFVVYGSFQLTDDQLTLAAETYRNLLIRLRESPRPELETAPERLGADRRGVN